MFRSLFRTSYPRSAWVRKLDRSAVIARNDTAERKFLRYHAERGNEEGVGHCPYRYRGAEISALPREAW